MLPANLETFQDSGGERVQKRLVKAVVDATHASDRDVLVWDTGVPGFGLRVRPVGAQGVRAAVQRGEARRHAMDGSRRARRAPARR